MAKILLVEDDESLADNIIDWLSHLHHTVEAKFDGLSGLQQILCAEYDLIILDWALPELTGLEICKRYKTEGGAAPVLMLTGRNSINDKTLGLDSGADDYLTKPFHMEELSARIRSLLRRATGKASNRLSLGYLGLDLANGTATRCGEPLSLLPKEFALFEFLMRHPDEVFSADALLEKVWMSGTDATAEAIRTTLKRLRKKIDAEGQPSLLHTVHGVGYKLSETP